MIGLPLGDTVNMNLAQLSYYTPTSPQRLLSSVPKVAVVERFDCIRVFSQTSKSSPRIYVHMSFQLQSKLSPCDHSSKRPALVTTTYVKPPFEPFLKLCNKKLTFGIT